MSSLKKKIGKKIGNSWIQRLIGLKTNPRFEELYCRITYAFQKSQ